MAPTVAAVATGPQGEGGIVILSAHVSDPGIGDWFSVNVDWGDGTSEPPPPLSADRDYTFSHVYADNGNYAVGVHVRDDDTSTGQISVPVTIINIPPAVTYIAVSTPVLEGGTANLTGTFIDTGTLDTHTAEIDWGDNDQTPGTVTETPFGPPGDFFGMTGSVAGSHVYADNGTYHIKLTVRDDDGDSHFLITDVVVNNVVPTLSDPGSQIVDEGQSCELTSMFSDPGFSKPSAGTSETFSYRIEWGDGAVEEGPVTNVQNGQPGTVTSGTIAGQHVYADNRNYTATIKVRDDDMTAGTWITNTVLVTVRNVVPSVVLSVASSPVGDEGSQFVFNPIATFTDPGFSNPLAGTVETFTYQINWGDGKSDQGTITDVQQGRPGVLTHGSFDEQPHLCRQWYVHGSGGRDG